MSEPLERRISACKCRPIGLFQKHRLAALDRPTTTKNSPEQFPNSSCAFLRVWTRYRAAERARLATWPFNASMERQPYTAA